MKTDNNYRDLKKYIQQTGQKRKKKVTQRNTNYKKGKINKSKKYKYKKTSKNDLMLQKYKELRNKTRKKNLNSPKKTNLENSDLATEYVYDYLVGGSFCGIPNIKKINRRLEKLNSKDFKTTINKLKPLTNEFEFKLNRLKLLYTTKFNNIRAKYNYDNLLRDVTKFKHLIKLIQYKLEKLKIQYDQKELSTIMYDQNIKVLKYDLKAKFKKNKQIYLKNKFDKKLKSYKDQFKSIKNKKFFKKMTTVLEKLEEYRFHSSQDYEDPPSSVKKILKKGKKCIKKWVTIEDFKKEKFQTSNEVLNMCLNLKSKNDQMEKFLLMRLQNMVVI